MGDQAGCDKGPAFTGYEKVPLPQWDRAAQVMKVRRAARDAAELAAMNAGAYIRLPRVANQTDQCIGECPTDRPCEYDRPRASQPTAINCGCSIGVRSGK